MLMGQMDGNPKINLLPCKPASFHLLRFFLFGSSDIVKFLVLSASHGEGHNTAARNVRDAILSESPYAEVHVMDLFGIALPHLNHWIQRCYSLAINQFTFLWKVAFLAFDREGTVEATLPFLGLVKRELNRQIKKLGPDIIISTYPLYSFLIRGVRKHSEAAQVPFVTVVTDSTMINSVWYRYPSDAFVVADASTARVLSSHGVAIRRIHVLGFPVSLDFENIAPLPQSTPPPWKILFLPSTRVTHSLRVARLLLALPDIYLTILSGKHPHVAETIRARLNSERLRTVSWTKQVPQLLASHHLFIGKAGGAITQEAIAAQCPMVVSHFVPGQEEGNIQLIEEAKIGILAAGSVANIGDAVVRAFSEDAILWKFWKKNIIKVSYPSASREIAKLLLKMAVFSSP
jgi:processive 1,2-diacylglycerol beta-glucosyltransferase